VEKNGDNRLKGKKDSRSKDFSTLMPRRCPAGITWSMFKVISLFFIVSLAKKNKGIALDDAISFSLHEGETSST